MAQILVRNLDEATIERLKARARNAGRSLQAEAKLVLEAACCMSLDEVRAAAGRWQRRFAGRIGGNSAEMVREDRDR